MPMTLTERLAAEADRAADEIYKNPTEHDRLAAKAMVMRGAEVELQYIKEIGIVGLPTIGGSAPQRTALSVQKKQS
jgi:hypothetical protein